MNSDPKKPTVDELVAKLRIMFEDMGLPDHETTENALLDRIIMETWNARGAADKKIVGDALALLMGNRAAGPYLLALEKALDALNK